MNELAPVVLFVYNRPEHTKKTIEALSNNYLASESELFIFSDGPKTEKDLDKVNQVRDMISKVEGFKKVSILNAKENKGLAKSVIGGVTSVLEAHQNVIVLEDDLITVKYFLRYMNDALNYYSNDLSIWSISGYTPRIEFPKDYKSSLYLSPRANSWGWATWKNRWDKIDWEIKNYRDFLRNKDMRSKFNLGGNDMSLMLDDQMNGRIDSWAIRWCYNQFLDNSYTVYPNLSFVENIGVVGESTHGSFNKRYITDTVKEYNIHFEDLQLDNRIMEQFRSFYNLTFINIIGILFKKIGIYNYVKKMVKKIGV